MRLRLLEDLAEEITALQTVDQLSAFMGRTARRLGFDHYALTYDQWSGARKEGNFLLHDYPDPWARVYTNFDLGNTDPVKRTCEHCMIGFPWRDVRRHISLTKRDKRMLLVGEEHGLSDGYTVPRHLPGQATGSCTFVVGRGRSLPGDMLPIAEHVGAQALAAAKRLVGIKSPTGGPVLSERQRQCVLWSACGRSAKQIARKLGIAEGTVIQHLRVARERYGVSCSESLILCALFDGLFGFTDILPWLRLQ